MIHHIECRRSKRGRLLIWLLRRMRTRLRRREQLLLLRHKTHKSDRWFQKRYRKHCTLTSISQSNCNVDCLTPTKTVLANEQSDRKLLLFFHGGAYCLHSPGMYRTFLAGYLSRLGCEGRMPDYRLAPEHPHPSAIEDCFSSYKQALDEGYKPANIAIMGDSAGGGLSLSVLKLIKDKGLPMPSCVALISPAGDWTLEGPSFYENEDLDPVFYLSSMLYYRDLYLGGNEASNRVPPHDPLVSPVLADMQGYPPIYACTNSTELIRDVSVNLERRATAAGVPVEVEIWPGMPHDLPLLGFLPEARQNNQHIERFLRRHLER